MKILVVFHDYNDDRATGGRGAEPIAFIVDYKQEGYEQLRAEYQLSLMLAVCCRRDIPEWVECVRAGLDIGDHQTVGASHMFDPKAEYESRIDVVVSHNQYEIKVKSECWFHVKTSKVHL